MACLAPPPRPEAMTPCDELARLQQRYESRLSSLATQLRASQSQLGVILAEGGSHLAERMIEALQAAVASEQERQIGVLCREAVQCEAALLAARRDADDARRDADNAQRDADDARAALPQLMCTADRLQSLEVAADRARAEAEKLRVEAGAEQAARKSLESQLEQASRLLGSMEAQVARLEADLAAAQRDARLAREESEERVRSVQAAAAAQREGHMREVASATALLHETAASAARTDGERVAQITSLQESLLTAQQAGAAAEERARLAEADAAKASEALAEAQQSLKRGSQTSACSLASGPKQTATDSLPPRQAEDRAVQATGGDELSEARATLAQAEAERKQALIECAEARADRDALDRKYRRMGEKVKELMEYERTRPLDARETALRSRVEALEGKLREEQSAHRLAASSWGEEMSKAAAIAARREAELAREHVQAVREARVDGIAEGEARAASELAYRRSMLERELGAARAIAETRASELAASRDELSRALSDVELWRGEVEACREALRQAEFRAEERMAELASELRAQATLVERVKGSLEAEAADEIQRVTSGHAAALEAVRAELGAAYSAERAKESDCITRLLEEAVAEADARVAAAESEAIAARATAASEANASVERLEALAEEARRALVAQRAEMEEKAAKQVEAAQAQHAEARRCDLAALKARYEAEWMPLAEVEAAIALAIEERAQLDADATTAALREQAAKAEERLEGVREELRNAHEAMAAAEAARANSDLAAAEANATRKMLAEERIARALVLSMLSEVDALVAGLQEKVDTELRARVVAETNFSETHEQLQAAHRQVVDLEMKEAEAAAARVQATLRLEAAQGDAKCATAACSVIRTELEVADRSYGEDIRLIKQLSDTVKLLQMAQDKSRALPATLEARYEARLAAAAEAHERERREWRAQATCLTDASVATMRRHNEAAAVMRKRLAEMGAQTTALREEMGMLKLAVRTEMNRATCESEGMVREIIFDASAIVAAKQATIDALRASLDAERAAAAVAAREHTTALQRATAAAAEAVGRAEAATMAVEARVAKVEADKAGSLRIEEERHAAAHAAAVRRLEEMEARLRTELSAAGASEAALREELLVARAERDSVCAVNLPMMEARAIAAEKAAEKAEVEMTRFQKRLAATEEMVATLRAEAETEREAAAQAMQKVQGDVVRLQHEAAAANSLSESAKVQAAKAQAKLTESISLQRATEGLVRKLACELALPMAECDAALAGGDFSELESALLSAHDARERADSERRAGAVKAAVDRVRDEEVRPLRVQVGEAQCEAGRAAALAAEAQFALREAREEVVRLANELRDAEARERRAAAAAEARLERQRERAAAVEAAAVEAAAAHAEAIKHLEEDAARRSRASINSASASLHAEIEALTRKLESSAVAHREELQARESRHNALLEAERAESEKASDDLRAATAAREMELHAQLQAAQHDLVECHAQAELEAARRRDETLRANGDLNRALSDVRRLEEKLVLEREEHARALAQAEERAERLQQGLAWRERQTLEAATRGEERGRELSALADILHRSLAQVSLASIADATMLESQTKELKLAAERRASKVASEGRAIPMLEAKQVPGIVHPSLPLDQRLVMDSVAPSSP